MTTELTPTDWEAAQRVLRAVLREPALADDRAEFRTLVAGVNRAGRKHARQQTVPPADVPRSSSLPRCYICKDRFAVAHPTNPALCPPCGALNAHKRSARTDLTGRTAVLTGGRVKIGYALSLKLLRDGARVIVTTRFPQDAARRYAQEPDVADWQDRLMLYGLDLRDLRGVQAFKGMESPVVLLTDLQGRERQRQLHYIGASRATNLLVVFADAEVQP